ncbi:MAG: CBS domain-containing protein [Pyrinomonadaceae bacterium]
MKVEKIMTKNVGTCSTGENLGKAVFIMWQKDCGVVPVLDADEKVIGMITDRDVCIALTSRNQRASEVLVNDLTHGNLISCSPKDSVKSVLRTMAKHKIKRLPVTGKKGNLKGIISIADILRLKKKKSLRKSLAKTLEEISKPASIVLKQI